MQQRKSKEIELYSLIRVFVFTQFHFNTTKGKSKALIRPNPHCADSGCQDHQHPNTGKSVTRKRRYIISIRQLNLTLRTYNPQKRANLHVRIRSTLLLKETTSSFTLPSPISSPRPFAGDNRKQLTIPQTGQPSHKHSPHETSSRHLPYSIPMMQPLFLPYLTGTAG